MVQRLITTKATFGRESYAPKGAGRCSKTDHGLQPWLSFYSATRLNQRVRRHQMSKLTVLEDLPESEVDASGAGQWMPSLLERSDTVIDEASGTAPYRNVTAFEAQAADRIGAAFPAPQEY